MSLDPNTPNPYAASTPPTAPKKSNTLLYVLGGIAVFFVIACCGCGGLAYWGGTFALKAAAEQVKPQLAADPVIQEHIGNLQTAEISVQAYVAEATKNPRHQQAGRDIGIKVTGDKGTGLVVCKIDQSNPGQPRVTNAELVLPSGEAYPLSE
jgi:hypothetical protein